VPSILARLDTLRRDLRTISADLTGRARLPPFTLRSPSARHLLASASTAPRAQIATRPLRITRVERETADCVSLYLADPQGRRIAFVPGQFFTVLVPIRGGEVLRRAYSISSMPDADGAAAEVGITIKRLPEGRASNHLNDHAREGDLLEILGPSGGFTTAPDADLRRHVVLIGGGSGITPLMSIARSLLAREPHSHVSLVYGNRREQDIIFRAAIDALAAENPGRFTRRLVLDEPPPGWTGGAGMLDEQNVDRELSALPQPPDLDPEGTEYYVCGPEGMMAAARHALTGRGVPTSRIREERFSAPARRTAPVAPDTPQPVTIRIGGADRKVVALAGQTLLEAGLAGSLQMPYSCSMGGCGACKVKLVSGTVASEEPSCLRDEERGEGFVLACVSRATSPCAVEIP
jgi:ferredoxin-NADP reductase